MSGLTVVIGLATLALADYGAFQRFAVPFSFGVLVTGFAVVTLLPAVLGILGRAAFWPFVPRTVDAEKAHAEKKNKPVKARKENHRFMKEIGDFVTSKPWIVIIVAGAILIGLAFNATNIKYNYDLISSFPEDMPSREGFKIIEENLPCIHSKCHKQIRQRHIRRLQQAHRDHTPRIQRINQARIDLRNERIIRCRKPKSDCRRCQIKHHCRGQNKRHVFKVTSLCIAL